MTADPTDAQIIQASLESPEAFESVFERHYDVVRRYLQRRVGVDVGEELAAQTFLVAFDRLGAYDPRYPSAKPWLMGIATNLIRHHLRDEQFRLAALARAVPDPSYEPDVDEGRLDAARAGRRIGEALLGLPAADRDAFLLHVLGDLSYRQVGWALQIPLGTVRSRIHRARRRLREQLEDVEAINRGRRTD